MSRPRTVRTKLGKMDISFHDEMRRIAAKRVAEGRDKIFSPGTVQRKLIRHNLWQQIKKDLEIAEFLKEERGQVDVLFSPFRFVIVVFLAILFFGGLIYVTGLLNNSFIQVGLQNEANAGQAGYVNLTQAAQNTFGKVNESIQGLRMVAIAVIFSEILLIFVFNSFLKIHPALFVVWIFIVFLAVMLAAPVANAYEQIVRDQVYNGLLESFTGANWLILNLPIVTLMVGVIGGIFMFINILRTGGEQGI